MKQKKAHASSVMVAPAEMSRVSRTILVFPSDRRLTNGAMPKQIASATTMQMIPITVRFPTGWVGVGKTAVRNRLQKIFEKMQKSL